MSDNNTSLVPDVIKSASDVVQTNLPETAKQTDSAISTVIGFFNNVVLYPVKKANISFKYKLEAFEDDLKEKVKKIPDKNLQIPPTMIVGPALEALRYTYDEIELREMYENLLASAMDNRKTAKVRPGFVDAIRQMNPLDAVILKRISEDIQMNCATIRFDIKDEDKAYILAMPDYFIPEFENIADPFDVSASICNLQRLGLITIIYDQFLFGSDPKKMIDSPFVQKQLWAFKSLGKEIVPTVKERIVLLNNYGDCFKKICLTEEDSHAD